MAGPARSEEWKTGWESTPLFMRDLPDDAQDSIALSALQSLIYEDGPEETAKSLRMQANEYFKNRKFREASSFYSQAITELGHDMSTDTKRTLFTNRAACHLELQNYASCLKDCATVFELGRDQPATDDPSRLQTTRKALYRSARALLALGKFEGAEDALTRLRASGEPNEALERQFQQARAAKEAKGKEAEEQAKARAETELRFKEALQSRGLILPRKWSYATAASNCPTDVRPPRFDADEPDLLCFPVFLLRPLASPPTRDLILEWIENVPVSMHFDAAQFDPSHEAYITTTKGRLLKVGRKLTLSEIIRAASKPAEQDGLALRDDWCLEIYAVPKAGASAWTEEMKRQLRG